MSMRIDEAGKMYAPLLNMAFPEKKSYVSDDCKTGERDSYISSVGDGKSLHTTGNYDEQGQMDDDFSVEQRDGDGGMLQMTQYNREYAEQTMKTVTGAGASDAHMGRKQ